uniref:Serine/threonine-protein phosphatase 4 regulatory subunit 2 n=1 Tax=Glossina brevipalpis TaxID=37001 RepID=A0A1A9WM93_9MUSC
MATMKNAEEVMQILERFTRLKQKEIPKELDEYLGYVAKTGDTVFKWSSLKYLFREKLLSVIKNFLDNTPRSYQIPHYPNVDPFDYEDKKSSLVERLELFNAAPFTIQRLCELLIDPYRHYNRIDKFMRALEKTIFVISTIEPGCKYTEIENNDSLDSAVKGNLSLDVNVDIDIATESLSTMETAQNAQSSNGSNNKSDVEEKKGTEDKSNDNSESKTEEIKRSVDTTVSNKGGNMILTKIGAEIAKKGEMTVEEKEQDDVKGRNTEQQDPIKCQEDVEITQEITIKTLDKKETNRIDVVEQTAKEKNKVLSTTTEQQTKEETKEKEITIETIEKLAESNIPEEQADNIKESNKVYPCDCVCLDFYIPGNRNIWLG